jgi:DNA modification methylase
MIEVKNPNNLKTAHIDSFKPLQGELKDLSQENYNKLKNSILKHGFNIPVFVWNGYLLDGHQRQRVLLQEGWNVEVPYVEIEAETELEAKEILLKITSQYGKITLEGLDDFYPEWQELDINFDAISILDTEEPQEVIEDEVPEPPLEPKTVLGDLYEIGEHRLLCGDSTDSDQVTKLMNGEKADMVFTDPPYGMNLDTDYSKMPSTKKEGNKNYNKIKGDNEDFTDELINTIFACFNDCKEIFIWGADYFAELLPNKNQGSWIVWDKRVEEKFDKMIGSAFELCWSKSKHQRQIARFNNTLFSGEQDARNKVHPTQKPIKLACWFLEQWSAKENLIADLFLGSGSTMVASHQLKRKCYGMELDCRYADVIVKRMLKLDKTLKIKKNGIDETEKWLKLIE